MQLLIDAGNTQIKWAVAQDGQHGHWGQWQHVGAFSHAELRQQQLPWHALPLRRVLISNVAGAVLREQLQAALTGLEVSWFASLPSLAGIRNGYRDPAQLGCDRFATAIAAHTLFPQRDLIVATCGTATTIDAITAQGDFVGGMIVPGLKLMAQSLQQNTAQLPGVAERGFEGSALADHTQAGIISGCLAAQAGAIERALREFEKLPQVAGKPFCVLSGGAAKYIAPGLALPCQVVDNLVLIGLQVSLC